jgi:uncharacterized protein YbaP (TraB family)
MKKIFWLTLLTAFGLAGAAQTTNNTLLWRITGKNTTKPSYLFGTIHMICATDIQLSDSLKTAIHNADKVYLELDMDNMFEMLGALGKMKMRNDTTLSDLLTKEEYQKVKEYFNKKGGLIPFSMLETYKPMLAASTLMEQNMDCDNMIVMEQLVMEEAKKSSKEIKGLESVNYQMSIFDSIPYTLQAKQLLKYVEDEGKGESSGGKELEALTKAYRNQELKKLEDLINSDQSLGGFNDILLYNRNANWVKKLQTLLSSGSIVIAVGAGHLPGDKGVINLLRKAGYKVEPVKNEMIRKRMKEI